MDKTTILDQLPYSPPFLFVDEIYSVNDNSISGGYFFDSDLDFYRGHFKKAPVTPGVILTECMAQIGVVCLGIYLNSLENMAAENSHFALSSTDIEFLKPVFPGEKVRVEAEKQYFRFHKLKSKVEMFNEKGELVCRGIIAGMILKSNNSGK
ncbi:beta-hydroxyacyl-ACP dehydratase [Pontixanthobacter gangjinensis]|uniref:Hydroxymyristoyl-ACP dehydratase n=1 Tax=Christiangramia aestuarii TaxID=1028746 RepID=A0A7K1LPT8_9FLAO|nr:FabA/FabZ family ACP-dehydratase [Christiangramia aestuarii]MUP42812.1 hydroxymyristoyl-ACP dehydratase [Christiangramia aestuarii]